jgi:hypothetical protein
MRYPLIWLMNDQRWSLILVWSQHADSTVIGHLTLEDGIGADRRHARLPRVGHGLKRLVVIGSDGTVSLAALRWLADQDAAFVMLERDGSLLATTGPVRPSDVRLRRAQGLAPQGAPKATPLEQY